MKENKKFEQHTINSLKQTSAEGILYDYEKSGRIDLSVLPKDKKIEVKNEYLRSLDKLKPNSKTEILEQLLLSGAIEEQEAVAVAQKIEKEEKAKIADFLVNVVTPGRYTKLFQNCFESMSKPDQDSTLKSLTGDDATTDTILMALPFMKSIGQLEEEEEADRQLKKRTNAHYKKVYEIEDELLPKDVRFGTGIYINNEISRLAKRIKKNRDIKSGLNEDIEKLSNDFHSKERKTYLDKYFSNAETAKRLMDEVLSLDPHNDNNKKKASSIIQHYKRNNPIFLLPYLPKLVEQSLIDQDMAKLVLNRVTQVNAQDLSRDRFWKTEEEIHREQEIKKEAGLEHKFFNLDDFKNDPRSVALREEIMAIENASLVRAAQHTLENFRAYTTGRSKQEKFTLLENLIQTKIPVFAEIEKTELSKDEVKKFIRQISDQKISLYNLSSSKEIDNLVSLGLEKEAVAGIMSDIENLDYSIEQRYRIINNLPTILSSISDKSKEKIIDSINTTAPSAWLKNIDNAIDSEIITINQLEKIVTGDDYRSVMFYPNLIYRLRKSFPPDNQESEAEFQKRADRAREIAKNAIHKNVGNFLYEPEKILNIITQKELDEIMLKSFSNRENGSENAFTILSSKNDNEANQQKSEIYLRYRDLAVKSIRSILLESPETIFDDSSFQYGGHYKMKTLLSIASSDEIKNAFIKCLGNASINEAFQNDDLVNIVFKDNNARQKILKFVASEEGKYYLFQSLEGTRHLESEDFKDFWDKARGIFERTLKTNNFLVFKINSTDRFWKNDEILKRTVLDQIISESEKYLDMLPGEIENVLNMIKVDRAKYNEFVAKHLPRIALLSGSESYERGSDIFDLDRLESDVIDKINKINPLLRLETGINESTKVNDFYTEALKILERFPTFILFEHQLKRIVKQEIELRENAEFEQEYVNQEFRLLFKEIILLNDCKWFNNNIHTIKKESKHKQAEIIALAKSSLSHKIRDNELFNINDQNLSELKDLIRSKLMSSVSEIIGIDLNKGNPPVEVTPKLIEALLVYHMNSCQNNRAMSLAIKETVQRIFNGKFIEFRQWGDQEMYTDIALSELIEKKLLPRNTTLKQYDNWVDISTSSLDENLKISVYDLHVTLKKNLDQAVFDNHIDNSVLGSYDELLGYYRALTSGIESMTNEEEKKGFIAEHLEEMNLAKALIYLSKLKSITSDELEKNQINIEGKPVGMEQVWKTIEKGMLEKFPNFKTDIDKIKTVVRETRESIFSSGRISKSKLTITDKVDLEKYFYIGAEPVPSCQNYASNNSGLNFGLLAYLEDANTKVVQVYDEDGILISRNIMRLLEDENGEPNIFLERIYSVNLHPKIEEGVLNFAKRKAATMGVRLYSESIIDSNSELDVVEYKTLYSKGSRAPFVYTDSGGGKRENGVYQVRGKSIV